MGASRVRDLLKGGYVISGTMVQGDDETLSVADARATRANPIQCITYPLKATFTPHGFLEEASNCTLKCVMQVVE